ncbi:MAG TPA: PilZ domain-containing protein [Nitrospira sp.]|nr:PilZ domain-containing protein [Nitrospira sp.]
MKAEKGAKERKIRKAQRVNFRCSLGFRSDEIEGEATVTNISPSGCRAESDVNVAEGLELQVWLHLPGQSDPVKVERASIRWASGSAFGMSFILFLPSERVKLRQYLGTLK